MIAIFKFVLSSQSKVTIFLSLLYFQSNEVTCEIHGWGNKQNNLINDYAEQETFLHDIQNVNLSIRPQQIHLSYGEKLSFIVVTWTTYSSTEESIVEYGINGLSKKATGHQTRFVDPGALRTVRYIHRVTLPNLQAGKIYSYRCGSNLAWSDKFWFKSSRTDPNWKPHVAVFGDLGYINGRSVPRLRMDTNSKMYDAVLHVGDLAYDMYELNGIIGDKFMNKIQPIAAHLPYMTVPGNHEQKYNFSHYKNRFSMPGNSDNMMYTLNMGPIHFIGFSTEVYYFFEDYGFGQLINQYHWLEKKLKEATKPKNRAKRPWIVTFGHRPMYCSTKDNDDCDHDNSRIRIGICNQTEKDFGRCRYGLEKLFYDYGVDLEIWAHEHVYERLWPVYKSKVYNGSLEKPYTNPKAPVHIITGSAGCDEGRDLFKKKPQHWSAFHSRDYGYTRLKAHNGTHLYLEQVSDEQNGKVIDNFWLIKHHHGRYSELTEAKQV